MRNRVAILAVSAVFPLTGLASLAAAGPAGADPNSKTVTVQGSVDDCEDGTSPATVSITTGQETRRDSGPDVGDSGAYKVTFKNVSKKGVKATATVTCEEGAKYRDTFTLKRPLGTSTTQTVNLEP
ncbi:hypothetical protein [Streptomyces sp. NPDC051636]|uniref:hypothetical protein n=1 Tax=Streptomyces sp. NPDC051636 TaxID=3365663 RepID=UPI0037B35464